MVLHPLVPVELVPVVPLSVVVVDDLVVACPVLVLAFDYYFLVVVLVLLFVSFEELFHRIF